MKRSSLLIIGLLLIILSACTPRIYGVPQPTWERMSEPERISAMDTYKQRQIARQRAAAVRAQQQKIYMEEQRRQQVAAEATIRQRIDAIYRGGGNYGDLIRVHVENGAANFRGQVRQYDPVSFQIANGETKSILITTTKRRTVVLDAYYDGATLYLDGNKNSRKSHMSQLHYDKRWSRGVTYENTYTNNKAKLKGADVTVEIVGDKRYRDHNRHRPSGSTTIIINEQPTQKVIIRERPQQIIIKDKPAKTITGNIYKDRSSQQRQRHEQLKKERRAIDKQRKALKREQAEFKAQQQALENERAALTKKRDRIKQLKKEAARDKKQAASEKQADIREREKTVNEMEKELQEQSKKIEQEEKKVQRKRQKVKQQEKKIKQDQQQIEKEEEKLQEEKKDKKLQ